jgi:hypothetical protein
MLVMRNFGYLGLHKVVDKKSSLSRDRLVDFTGELQLRVRERERISDDDEKTDPYTLTLPDWHPLFVAEPTLHGGRNLVEHGGVSQKLNPSRSHLYAQELAPIPLQASPSAPQTGKPALSRGRLHGHDIEPFYHTSFCNEMLFHPRLLHNCPKGNIAIKVELRELEWKQDFNGYFAHLPRNGPHLHNNRRGPFLVQSAFTSCSRGGSHHFIDEFKAKLPLDLKPSRQIDGNPRTLSLVFTVYNVKLHSKSTWKRGKKLFSPGATKSTGSADVAQSEDTESYANGRLERIACGFLPVTSHDALIQDGMHDVRVAYSVRSPPKELCDSGAVEPTTMVLVEKNDAGESFGVSLHEDSYAENTIVSTDSFVSDRIEGSEAVAKSDGASSVSDLDSTASQPRGGKTKGGEPLSLSVSYA